MLGKDFKTPEHAETLSKRASVSVACVCAVLITPLTQFYIVVLCFMLPYLR